MTIEKAIDVADNLRPNTFTYIQKVEWLSKLDNQIYEEIFLMARKNWTHEIIKEEIDGEVIEKENPSRLVPVFEFEGYDEQTPEGTELLADTLYDNLYIDYLIAKYSYYSREMESYNVATTVFNAQYQQYANWYRQKYEPVKRRVQRI
jgi:hypothetical protein